MNRGKVNILFVMLQLQMGGAERLIYNLAHGLDRTLFNPSIAWFLGTKTVRTFEELAIPLFHIPKVRRFDFYTMEQLGEVIDQNNIDVVNAHHFMSLVYSLYGCKLRNRARLVYTEHSEWEIEQASRKWKILGRYVLNRADAAVGVSDQVSRKLRENYKISSAKTFTILNGIELDAFSKKADKIVLRNKLGVAAEDKVIGIVANFRRIKNHIFLLKAFSQLIKECRNAKLLLIGQGFTSDVENTEKEIRTYVNENDLKKHVIFLGYRPDVDDLLQSMDIFCLPSFKEGLPISMIEAMAAGLPVVGTDTTGIRDVVVPGRNGFLVPVDDINSLKNLLSKLVHDRSLRKQFGAESRLLAKRQYSLEKCTTTYQDLFLSVLNK